MVWVYFFGALLGLCVGSFLNVVIYRLPNGMNLATPPSHCPGCNHQLAWYENIPLFSYLFLGGKCKVCKMRISPRYPLIEAANMILWVLCILLFWKVSIPLACLFAAACSLVLCMIATDLDDQTVPQILQLILLVIAVAVTILDKNTLWYHHLIGGVAFGGIFWLVGFLFQKKRGRESLGGADVELAFTAGLLLGWQKMLLAMLLASLSASILLLILRKRDRKKAEAEKASKIAEAIEATVIAKQAESIEETTVAEPAEQSNAESAAETVIAESQEPAQGMENPESETSAEQIDPETLPEPINLGEEEEKTYPFVPFMGGGIFIALFLGDLAIQSYMNWLMSFVR